VPLENMLAFIEIIQQQSGYVNRGKKGSTF
jgi:hypothetical protein